MYKALFKGMEAVLHYERLYKRIPPLNNDFSSVFYAFKEKCVPRYGFSREGIMVVQDIKGILDHQKTAPIEFRRGADRFIMADRDFRMQSLDITKVKNYLKITKEFVFKVNSVYNKAIATHSRGM